EKAEEPSLAYLLSRMVYPRFPECVGVFRCVQRPTYDELLNKQIEDVVRAKGKGKLDDLFASDDVCTVEAKLTGTIGSPPPAMGDDLSPLWPRQSPGQRRVQQLPDGSGAASAA